MSREGLASWSDLIQTDPEWHQKYQLETNLQFGSVQSPSCKVYMQIKGRRLSFLIVSQMQVTGKHTVTCNDSLK